MTWSQEEVLAYVYGKKADFELDKYYGYSNTNFLLLGMILEEVSGKSLKEVYEEQIFGPLGMFMKQLMAGQVVSESCLAQMQDWFEKPFAWAPEYTITNGYGLEYLDTDYGEAFGHTGGVDGFASALNYYPGPGITIVVLFNFVPGTLEVSEDMDDFETSLEQAVFE